MVKQVKRLIYICLSGVLRTLVQSGNVSSNRSSFIVVTNLESRITTFLLVKK